MFGIGCKQQLRCVLALYVSAAAWKEKANGAVFGHFVKDQILNQVSAPIRPPHGIQLAGSSRVKTTG